MRTTTPSFVIVGVLSGLVLALPGVDAAAQAPVVTALSAPSTAHWTSAEGQRQPLVAGAELWDGSVEVAAEQQLMMYCPVGEMVMVAFGPCAFGVAVEDERVDVELRSGRLMLATSGLTGEPAARCLIPDEGRTPLVVIPGGGWNFFARQAGQIDVAFVAEAPEAPLLRAAAAGSTTRVTSGGRLTLTDGQRLSTPLQPWLRDSGFDVPRLGERIGVASAQIERVEIQKRLVRNVLDWDVYSTAGKVIKRIKVQRFDPETRTAVAVTGQVQSTELAGTTARTQPFPAANEVPPLSPAAISVGGVTVIDLNENAERLLKRTGSRGLGFNGLSRLAMPGTRGGMRTTGPAGLGAQP